MSELDQFFEALEGDEEEASGDVSSFPDPTNGIMEECYADFQKATGITLPFSNFESIVLKDYKGNVDEGKSGVRASIGSTADPLVSKLTGCSLHIVLNMRMNYGEYRQWMYQHRGENITAEVDIYASYYMLSKDIPLARYKRLPTKGVRRTWINSNIKKD